MPSCITLNHSFSVSAASRTSWLDTQECDAPAFICIKGRVPRKGDETGIDLGGEPDGRDHRNRDRRRNAIQKWCLMSPRHIATLDVKKQHLYKNYEPENPYSRQVLCMDSVYFNTATPYWRISCSLLDFFGHFHLSWMIIYISKKKTVYRMPLEGGYMEGIKSMFLTVFPLPIIY